MHCHRNAWTKEANPARELRVKTPKTIARLWEPEDIAAFVTAADAMGFYSIGTAVLLNEWLGQREGDILAMTWADHRDGAIWIDQSKTLDGFAILPVDIIPNLKQRLAEERARQMLRAETTNVLATNIIHPEQKYRAYDEFNVPKLVRKIVQQAALTRPSMLGLVFRWLRHTAVTRLAEANVSVALIASITGHTEKSTYNHVSPYNRTKRHK